MHVAIVYATVEGQTRRIAEHIAARVRAAGHETAVADANADAPAALAGAAAAILAAPVHGGRYPAAFEHLARAERDRLAAIPTAFVSVTLAIIGEAAEREEAEAFPTRLAEASGWRPTMVHHAAGALRYSEYDFFKRWIMRLIARQHGYGDGAGDREFTDWDALDRFIDGFLAAAR
jgi:menaquinone-dependent protoporphyrinogen oxidase